MVSLPEHLKAAPVGREQLPREVLLEQQRRRVATDAIAVFAKRGYQGTTVDHIVSAAKVGVGRFYGLFEGKEGCFLAAYSQIIDDGRETIAAALPADGSWPERIASTFLALLELIEAEPLSARIVFVEVQAAGEPARALHRRYFDQAAALMREGRAHTEVPDELPPTLEFAMIGGLVWFLQQRIVLGETAGIAEQLPEVLEMVAEPYLGGDAIADLVATARRARVAEIPVGE